jgi:hypothetical protein
VSGLVPVLYWSLFCPLLIASLVLFSQNQGTSLMDSTKLENEGWKRLDFLSAKNSMCVAYKLIEKVRGANFVVFINCFSLGMLNQTEKGLLHFIIHCY